MNLTQKTWGSLNEKKRCSRHSKGALWKIPEKGFSLKSSMYILALITQNQDISTWVGTHVIVAQDVVIADQVS